MKNYYEVLGVDRNASLHEIKLAYRSLTKRHHPDKGGSGEAFKELLNAYQTLADREKRKWYDFENNLGDAPTYFDIRDDSLNTNQCFVSYINFYTKGNEFEDRYKDLTFQVYLLFFSNGFPEPMFSAWGMVKCAMTDVFTRNELDRSMQDKNYNKETWKNLPLPDSTSRYVFEFDLGKDAVEELLRDENLYQLRKHMVSAKEFIITKEKNVWELANVVFYKTRLIEDDNKPSESSFRGLTLFSRLTGAVYASAEAGRALLFGK